MENFPSLALLNKKCIGGQQSETDRAVLGMQFNQSSWATVRPAALVDPLSDELYDSKRLTFELILKH